MAARNDPDAARRAEQLARIEATQAALDDLIGRVMQLADTQRQQIAALKCGPAQVRRRKTDTQAVRKEFDAIRKKARRGQG